MFNLDDKRMAAMYVLFTQDRDEDVKPIIKSDLTRFAFQKFNSAKTTMKQLTKTRQDINKTLEELENKWRECQYGAQFSIEFVEQILSPSEIEKFSKKYKEASDLDKDDENN